MGMPGVTLIVDNDWVAKVDALVEKERAKRAEAKRKGQPADKRRPSRMGMIVKLAELGMKHIKV